MKATSLVSITMVVAGPEPRHRFAEAEGGGDVEFTGEAQFDDGAAPVDRQVERAGWHPPRGGGGTVPVREGSAVTVMMAPDLLATIRRAARRAVRKYAVV
jgi:hypothetical protein